MILGLLGLRWTCALWLADRSQLLWLSVSRQKVTCVKEKNDFSSIYLNKRPFRERWERPLWENAKIAFCESDPGFLPLQTWLRKGCVISPSLFDTCLDRLLGRVVDQSHCGASIDNIRVCLLIHLSDDAVIPAESLKILVLTLVALHDEANKPLEFPVSCTKTK